MAEPREISQQVLDCVAKNLSDIGAVSLEDYLDGQFVPPPPMSPIAPLNEPASDVNAVTKLHQACQRTFRSTDPLKFEFIEHSGSRSKQCILTITKPDGVRRSYTTQPIFPKKADAKLEAAKIAISMGALEFLIGEASAAPSSILPETSDANTSPLHQPSIEDVEQCCLEWRAGHVTPFWVSFSDPKSVYKQGCALRIQLSPHVVRVYVADPSFDTYLDAKTACAKLAVSEGVLDFIKHGDGQRHPPSPLPPALTAPSVSPPVTATSSWTLQAFFESLPRPFPESFGTSETSEINAPAWLNALVQSARGGKLVLSFFFTSDGPPGLHGCLLKLDRPGEYRASLVDAKFPKRSDAKAAVCLQAISEGIGDYIRSITSAIDAKVTHKMRSFSSSLVYPALVSELSKIKIDFHPRFEYDRERDAFGASLIVRLSFSPTPDQVRRYTVLPDYRNKADAKVGVICHAAEQGIIEFLHFRGGTPPDSYVSPYTLHNYDPDIPRKRKQSGGEDTEEEKPPKKKKKKGKRRVEAPSQDEDSFLASLGQCLSVHASSDQMHSISGPGDLGLAQSVPPDDFGDPSQPVVGRGNESGAAHSAVYGHVASYNARTHALSYPAVLDPRFVGQGRLDGRAYGGLPLYNSGSRPVGIPSEGAGEWSHARSSGGARHDSHRPIGPRELEPGEVLSSSESDFSESSSRNEDVKEVSENELDAAVNADEMGKEGIDVVQESIDKCKTKRRSPATMSTGVLRDGPAETSMSTLSHVKKLIDYCAQRRHGTPSFHHTQSQGRFQVWIVIGKQRFDLPTTYGSAEEGLQRVAKQVLVRLAREQLEG